MFDCCIVGMTFNGLTPFIVRNNNQLASSSVLNDFRTVDMAA